MTYSESVFVALDIQSVKRTRCSYVLPVQLYNIFSHYLMNGMIFEKSYRT